MRVELITRSETFIKMKGSSFALPDCWAHTGWDCAPRLIPCGARLFGSKNKLEFMRLISLLVCVSFTALAQTPASDVPTLQTLLVEVHQLRIALERSTQIAPRIQIAVERLKMQQEQVGHVAKDVDDARRELDHFRTEQGRIQQRVQSIENAVTETADPEKRRDLNDALGSSKQELDQAEKSAQQAQVREGELTSQLQSEQAKLTELNDRLNQIERALTTP
jgi:DNA repair exonuclease SbcCD ATPase subunit